jgi:transposase-like protein
MVPIHFKGGVVSNKELRREGVSEDVRECPIDADHLNEKQKNAIELLVCGKQLSEVAAAVEVDPRTLYRWRRDENFKRELDRRREEVWSFAADRLRSMVHPSLDVLKQQLEDRYEHTRFRAAETVLRLCNFRKAVQD